MKRKWITIDIDLGSWGITKDDSCMWAGADSLIAEVEVGGTFEQLLESATITFTDQDGGEAGQVPFDGSYMTTAQYEAIEQELAAKWAKEMDKLLPIKLPETSPDDDYDPTPWCACCGSMTRRGACD